MSINTEMKTYTIEPVLPKSCRCIDTWIITNPDTEEEITIIYTSWFRWGKFEITIYDKEREYLKTTTDDVCINDYEYEFVGVTDEYRYSFEIQNESKENIEYIKNLFEIDTTITSLEDIHIDDMEEYNGYLQDSTYTISDGVELTKVE